METPTLSPARVGSASSPPPLDTRLTDLVAELTGPVDPTRLNQEIEEFNLAFPIDVDTALNVLSVPPLAGVGTQPTPTTTLTTAPPPVPPPAPPRRPRPVTTSTRTRPVTATTNVPTAAAAAARRIISAGRRIGVGTSTTTTTRTAPTPRSRPTVVYKRPRRRPRPPSPPSSPSPPPSDDEGDDDDEDRRRGLRRRLDLLNEDAQQRSRGRRIRNITHTNTVTTVYEEGGRPSVRRTSTRTSSPSPPPSPPVEAAPAAVAVAVQDALEAGYKNPDATHGEAHTSMAPRRKRKRQRRRKRQKGGAVPIVVDWKKGFELVTNKNMWKIPSSADYKRAKKKVAGYKQQYRNSGSRDSYEKWLLKKGYATKSGPNCTIM